MPWSINQAVDAIKWIIESHGGNDDCQALRQICSYIAESEKEALERRIADAITCPHCQKQFLISEVKK